MWSTSHSHLPFSRKYLCSSPSISPGTPGSSEKPFGYLLLRYLIISPKCFVRYCFRHSLFYAYSRFFILAIRLLSASRCCQAAEKSSSSILIGPFFPEVLSPPILEFSKLLNAVPLRMRIVHSILALAFFNLHAF